MDSTDKNLDETWATSADVQQLLVNMLEMPGADHADAVRTVLEGSPLRSAHVVGIIRTLDKVDTKQSKWKGSVLKCKGAIYHVWLYHFLGGKSANLRPPPGTSPESGRTTEWSKQFMNAYAVMFAHMGLLFLFAVVC